MKKTHMIMAMPLLFLAFVLTGPSPSAAQPVLVVDRGTLAGNDFIDWGDLGPAFTVVNNPFSICSSSDEIQATVSKPTGKFERRDEGNGWSGNFAPGDALLWTRGSVGPMTVEFDRPVVGAGAQIQVNALGAFTATLDVYGDSDILLASFTVNGLSTTDADNSAIFIGALDDIASIKKIKYSVNNLGNDFAVNQVDLVVAPIEGSRTFSNKSVKFNFYYNPPSNRNLDYISIVGYLLKGACEGFELPFSENVTVTVTVQHPDFPLSTIQLFTQTIPAGTVAFSTTKYRFTSSKSGIKELLLQPTVDPKKIYAYLYVQKLELLPAFRSIMLPKDYQIFIRRIKSYNFTIQMDDAVWTGSAPLVRGDSNEYKQQLVFGP